MKITAATINTHLKQTIIPACSLISKLFQQTKKESILTFKINLRYIYGGVGVGERTNLHHSSVAFYSWLRK